MPTRRGRNQLLHASGTMPRRAKTKPMRAALDAMRTSIGSVIVIADADRRAVDRGDHRLLRLEDAQRDEAAAVAVLGERRPLAVVEGVAAAGEVGAGAEGAPRAGHDDDAHGVVGVGPVERVEQLVHHRRGERVQLLGAVRA